MARRSPTKNEKVGDGLDRAAARRADVGRRYRFVSPAGLVLDTYEVTAVNGEVRQLVNQATRGTAWASESWVRERPQTGRAHWVPEVNP